MQDKKSKKKTNRSAVDETVVVSSSRIPDENGMKKHKTNKTKQSIRRQQLSIKNQAVPRSNRSNPCHCPDNCLAGRGSSAVHVPARGLVSRLMLMLLAC